jgi:hypothetical protein
MNTHPDPWLPTRSTDSETATTEHQDNPDSPQSSRTLIQRLPQLLRLAGASTLLVAMYSFLVQGWHDSDDLLRYAMLLGHSLLLCGLGLASGHWLQEAKGARLLLSLALASVPANFAILGAFMYAWLGDTIPNAHPNYALWQLDSPLITLCTLMLALSLLIPVTLLGFRTLNRVRSTRLSLLFLASNALLLVPLRDPVIIAGLALPLALLMLISTEKTQPQTLAARTPSGLLARALQYLPLAVLAGRSLWFYESDTFLATSSLLILFLLARQLCLLLPGTTLLRGVLEVCSSLLTPMIAVGVVVLLEVVTADSLLLPLGTLVCAALLYELSLRVEMAPQLYRLMAMFVLFTGLLANIILFGGLTVALLGLATGIALALIGHHYQQLALFSTGLLLAGASLLYQLCRLLVVFDLGGWISLAVLGMLAILIGSVLESGGGRIRPRLLQLRQRFAQWEL